LRKKKIEYNKLIGLLCVGIGIGEGILHAGALHVLKYKEAIIGSNQEHWKNTFYEEHEQMIEKKVWKPIKLKYLPADSKLLSTTWEMKKEGQW
jgi:hypothetical protein